MSYYVWFFLFGWHFDLDFYFESLFASTIPLGQTLYKLFFILIFGWDWLLFIFTAPLIQNQVVALFGIVSFVARNRKRKRKRRNSGWDGDGSTGWWVKHLDAVDWEHGWHSTSAAAAASWASRQEQDRQNSTVSRES